MAQKRPSSGKNPSRKPSGRAPAARAGGAKKKAGKGRPSGITKKEGTSPAREGPPAKGRKEKRGKGKPAGREKPGRKSPERSSRESVELREFFKPEGLSLSLKFVLTISIMVFIIMVGFSLAIYAVAVSSLRNEMEDNGALMLKAVDAIGSAYFEDIRVTKATMKPPEDADEETAQSFLDQMERVIGKIKRRYTRYLKALLEHHSLDGETVRTTKLLNAMIHAEEGRSLDPKGGSKLYEVSKGKYVWARIKTDITIIRGHFKEKDGSKKFEMVLFRKELPGGEGKAMVVLSAERIAKTRNQLLLNVALSTVIGILIGVGVSFILASLVSKPVSRLLDDITKVSRGNLDHKTLPTSKDEIGVLARTFDAMTQNLKVAKNREIENQAREHDMKIATEIQAGLLPSKIPELKGYDLAAYYRPSKEVGGDYYDFFDIDKTHMGITVADVSGKGIPGSMVMTMARSLLRMEATRNLSTADTLKKVNKVIARDIRRGMFVTALYLILDVPNRKILISSAGHNPLVVYRGATKKLDMVNPNGIALGFDKGPIFDRTIKEEEISLSPGDRVVLYTDGVVEAMNAKHEEYSDERFFKVCQTVGARNSNQFINILVGDVNKHQGESEQHDDITISTFRVV